MGLKIRRGGESQSRLPFSTLAVTATPCPRRESNSDLRFRKPLFYPLNYGDWIPFCDGVRRIEKGNSLASAQRLRRKVVRRSGISASFSRRENPET